MTVKFERKTAQLGAGTLDYYVGGETGTDEEGNARLPLGMLHGATGHLETEVHQLLADLFADPPRPRRNAPCIRRR